MTRLQQIQQLTLIIALGLSLGACTSQRRSSQYTYLLNQSSTQQRPESPTSTSSNQVSMTGSPIIVDNQAPSGSAVAEGSSLVETYDIGSLAPASRHRTRKVIRKAESYLGTPYRYGGTSKRGIDCSGLVCQSFRAADLQLPHSSRELSRMGTSIPRRKLQEGDLVFFSSKGGQSINHVGIVTRVQGRQVAFIHATTSRGVRIDELNEGYWKNKFRKAVRL